MTRRLNTQFARLNLKNPIIVGSGPITDTYDKIRRAEDAGGAAVITKSIGAHEETSLAPTDQRRYQWIRGFGLHLKSTYRMEILSLDRGVELVRQSAESCDIPIIASVFYPALETEGDIEKWESILRALEAAGASALQLDFFYIDLRKLSDSRIDFFAAAIERLARTVSIPVVPKLNVGMDHDLIARLCGLPRIEGLVLIDSIKSEPLIDPSRNGAPLYAGQLYVDGRPTSVVTGEPLLHYTFSYTQRIGRLTSLPICSGGGLSRSSDVLQCLMLGASAVHFTSHLIRNGLGCIGSICSAIEDHMSRWNIPSLDRLIGSAMVQDGSPSNRYVKELPATEQRVRLDVSQCTHCGLCERLGVCNSFIAYPYQFEDHCDGCGFCINICPPRALVMEPIASKKWPT